MIALLDQHLGTCPFACHNWGWFLIAIDGNRPWLHFAAVRFRRPVNVA
jgi:hypothetical protein